MNWVLHLFFKNKHSLRLCFLFCLVFTYNIICNSQSIYSDVNEVSWLPRQAIRCIYQDSHSVLWVGTYSGLFKYDLFQLTHYNLNKKVNNEWLNNNVNAIAEDNFGNVLVGTGNSLGILDPVKGATQIVHQTKGAILDIAIDKSGLIWCLNKRNQIFRVVEKEKSGQNTFPNTSVSTINNVSDKLVLNDLAVMPGGAVLAASDSGLLEIDKNKQVLRSTAIKMPITKIFVADRDHIWLGTSGNGIYLVQVDNDNPGDFTITHHYLINKNGQKASIIALAGVGRKYLVFATADHLYIRNLEPNHKNKADEVFASGNELISLFVDHTANIWLGGLHGLMKIKRQSLDVQYIALKAFKNNPDIKINNLYYDHQNLWLASSKDGLLCYNQKTNLFKRLQPPVSGNVEVIKESANGNLVIARPQNILELKRTGRGAVKVINRIVLSQQYDFTSMLEVYPGNWWATTWRNGLISFSTAHSADEDTICRKVGNAFSNEAHLSCIIKDSRNNIWIGSRGDGLVTYNLQSGKLKHYYQSGRWKIPSDRILCIREDSKGNIWIGTRGKGLLLYEPETDQFRIFNKQSGLPSDNVCAIEENSNGELWVSTQNGLARYQPGHLLPFQPYGPSDKIANPEFAFNLSAAGDKGFLYFGNTEGIYQVKRLRKTLHPNVPIAWTDVEVLNPDGENPENNMKDSLDSALLQNVRQKGSIHLKHQQDNLRIGFAALDYTSPEKNRYAYRLKGLDSSWKFSEGAQQSVQYINLPAGRYTFEVKAANSLGDWTATPTFFNIVIAPSFWLSRNAFMLYSIIFLIIIISSWIIWKRWLRLQNELKMETEIADIQAHQMVFFDDLSHEIKNRLTLLLGPLEQALQGKKVNQLVLTNIYEQAQRLKRLTDQIMNIRKSQNGQFILNVSFKNMNDTLKLLIDEIEPLAVVKDINLQYKALNSEIEGWIDEEIVEIILLNLLSNSIKYVKAGGRIEVKIDSLYLGEADLPAHHKEEGNYFSCRIYDDGIGIPKAEIEKVITPYYRGNNNKEKKYIGSGIGLGLVTKLIKLHHGFFDLCSEPGAYTTFTFYIPIEKEKYAITELKPNINNGPIVVNNAETANDLIIPEDLHAELNEAIFEKRWNILIVDDNKKVLQLLKDCLEDEFVVIEASNGQEAWQRLNEHEIQIVISDLAMPKMDGLTLCLKLKTQDNLKHIPFIILTGRNSEEQKLVCFQNQVDDFIEKPFSPELLKWRIKTFLRKRFSTWESNSKKIIVIEPGEEIPESPDEAFIQSIVNLIEENVDNEMLDVSFLAERLYMSRATFYRRMERLVGESPSVFIRKYRLKKAALLLRSGNVMVSEAACKTGFKNPKYFTKCFQKEFGMNPADYISSIDRLVQKIER